MMSTDALQLWLRTRVRPRTLATTSAGRARTAGSSLQAKRSGTSLTVGWAGQFDCNSTLPPLRAEFATGSLTSDDKVSTVTADKITSMDGGGEDSVAYILLYR